jgi:hypothetical protein
MISLKKLFGICIAFVVLVGCVEKPELSNVVVLATPKNDSALYSYEKIRYRLRLFTINEYVDGLTISSLDLDRGTVICLDTLFELKKKELEYDFIYTAPSINRDELDVELSFIVKDNLGNTSGIKREIKVRSRQQILTEKNGIILYAHNAYLPNCLSLSDVAQPFVAMYAPNDSMKADIWLDPLDEHSSITLESKTEVKFVRHNDFNYSEATAESLQAAYLYSRRYDAIRNLAPNDIIIVGYEAQVKGVFFVHNIIYDTNLQCECIQLSFKGVD